MRFTSNVAAAVLSFIPQVLGVRLYVGTTSGTISTIEFNGASVSLIGTDSNASPAPTWQTIFGSNILVSTNEGPWNGQGSVVSYSINSSGQLVKVSSQTGLNGLLHAAVSPSGTFVAAAAYNGHGVVTYPLSSSGVLGSVSQTFVYTTPTGPVANRQDGSHPHQVIFDPSGKFLFANDLGADLIRIFSVGSGLTEYSTVTAPAGSGPRHGIFVQTDGGLVYYLVGEMGNTIMTFKVTYTSGGAGITLTPFQQLSSYGTATVPAKNPQVTAAEIQISPDKKFAYVSNRGDTSFSGTPASDSISAWKINSDGSLTFIQLLKAGGSTPRHFSLDPSGQYVAVALQYSNQIAFFRRDATTGLWPTTPVATWTSPTGPVCVQWLAGLGVTTSSTTTSSTTLSRTTTSTTISTTPVQTTTIRTTTTPIRTTTTSVRPTTTSSIRTTTPVVTTTTSASLPAQSVWGQCGGNGWTGPTTCAQGTCTVLNPWYSQCIP
ncbi:6-phosphogluconolactonase [Dactylellina cionopaga]|nr:6-phosphogluconolactonase [Dactylellina cionopaga]